MPKPNELDHQFFEAVKKGQLLKIKDFINRYGLSYSPHWLGGYALLCTATQYKQIEAVELLLENGSEVNNKSENPSMTPLHYAVKNNDVEVVEMLLNKGAHVDIEASDGSTPLLIAIRRNYSHIICLLLNHGAAFDVASTGWNESGGTLLHFACVKGHKNVVDLLLRRHADVNARDRNGSTPLHDAIDNEIWNSEIVECLLTHGADINAKNLKNQTPLTVAVNKDSLTTVRHILSYKPDSRDEYNRLALRSAVKINYCSYLVDAPLIRKLNSDYHNRLSLCSAVKSTDISRCHYGHLFKKHNPKQIVEDLLDYGFAIKPHDVADSSLLYAAVEKGYEQIVENLLICGADVNYSETTVWGKSPLLHTAVKEGQNAIVQLLSKYGADVNRKDRNGHTPMHLAIQKKNLGIAMQLLDNKAVVESSFDLLCLAIETKNTKTIEKILSFDGVDINATNSSGTTALHIAIEHGQTEMVKLFLDKGANVNDVTADGETALFQACKRGYNEVVEILLKFGAKSEFEGTRYAILLHTAAKNNDKNVVKILLKYDTEIEFKNDNGETALHIASQNQSIDVLNLLLEHGSDINSMTKKKLTAFDLADPSHQSNLANKMSYTRLQRARTVVEYLQRHMIKLTAANYYLNKKNVRSMDSSSFKNFRTNCEEEIKNMKSEKIVNNISFYDILTKEMNKLSVYSRNENIMQIFTTTDYITKFPIYASMIDLRFKKGMRRTVLWEQSYRFFDILSDSFPVLPHDCIDNIFNYFSNYDLRKLIKACE